MLLHPRFSYRACPNIVESLLLSPLLPPIIIHSATFLWRLLLWGGFSPATGDVMDMMMMVGGAQGHPLQFPLEATTTWMAFLSGLASAMLLPPVGVMLSEVTYDICQNMGRDRREERLPKVRRCFNVRAGGRGREVVAVLGRRGGGGGRASNTVAG